MESGNSTQLSNHYQILDKIGGSLIVTPDLGRMMAGDTQGSGARVAFEGQGSTNINESRRNDSGSTTKTSHQSPDPQSAADGAQNAREHAKASILRGLENDGRLDQGEVSRPLISLAENMLRAAGITQSTGQYLEGGSASKSMSGGFDTRRLLGFGGGGSASTEHRAIEQAGAQTSILQDIIDRHAEGIAGYTNDAIRDGQDPGKAVDTGLNAFEQEVAAEISKIRAAAVQATQTQREDMTNGSAINQGGSEQQSGDAPKLPPMSSL